MNLFSKCNKRYHKKHIVNKTHWVSESWGQEGQKMTLNPTGASVTFNTYIQGVVLLILYVLSFILRYIADIYKDAKFEISGPNGL